MVLIHIYKGLEKSFFNHKLKQIILFIIIVFQIANLLTCIMDLSMTLVTILTKLSGLQCSTHRLTMHM